MTQETKPTTKILRPFNILLPYRVRRVPVFIKITKHNLNRSDLSISGVEGPHRGGKAAGGDGQIDMHYKHRDESHDHVRYWGRGDLYGPEMCTFAPGWDADKWYKLLEVWHLYHLKKLDEIPQDVLEFLDSLPDADKTAAWV